MSQLKTLLAETVLKAKETLRRKAELDALEASIERRQALRDQPATPSDIGDTEPSTPTTPFE